MEFVSKLGWYVLSCGLQGFSKFWVKELDLNSTQEFSKKSCYKGFKESG